MHCWLTKLTLLFAAFGLASTAAAEVWVEVPCTELTRLDQDDGRPGLATWSTASTIDGTKLRSPADVAALARPIIVNGGDFSGWDFGELDLRGICFEGVNLARARWRRADGVAVSGASLKHADWQTASMQGAVIVNGELEGLRADHANLDRALIWGGEPIGFSARATKLRGALFRCGLNVGFGMCNWVKAPTDLRGADLSTAVIDRFPIFDWRARGAIVDGTTMSLDAVRAFRGARLAGPVSLTPDAYGSADPLTLRPAEFRQLLDGWSDEAPQVELPEWAPHDWMRSGQKLLYVDSDHSTQAFRRTDLYQRLLPLIIASSWSTLAVEVQGPDVIIVAGTSSGANGHMCTLSGEDDDRPRLRYRPDTGWFAPLVEHEYDEEEARGRLVQLTRDAATVTRRSIDCGARAGWSVMRRIPADDQLWQVVVSGSKLP